MHYAKGITMGSHYTGVLVTSGPFQPFVETTYMSGVEVACVNPDCHEAFIFQFFPINLCTN